MKIGDKFRKVRKQRGLSMKDVATRLGHDTVSTVQSWEKGRRHPKRENILAFAAAVGASAQEMMAGVDRDDLTDQLGTEPAGPASSGGPPADVAETRRIEKLEKENEGLRRSLAEVQRIATSLANVVADREKGARTRRGTTGRR